MFPFRQEHCRTKKHCRGGDCVDDDLCLTKEREDDVALKDLDATHIEFVNTVSVKDRFDKASRTGSYIVIEALEMTDCDRSFQIEFQVNRQACFLAN